jgi:hypothetical protein
MLAQQFDCFVVLACGCEDCAADDLHGAVFSILAG